MNLEIPIKTTVNIDVSLDDIIENINEQPIVERMNTIAKLMSNLEWDEFGDLSNEHKKIITQWLEKRLERFKRA